MQAATLLRAYSTPSDGTTLVALSGGADSVALLLALCEASRSAARANAASDDAHATASDDARINDARAAEPRVVAAHVNHMLRGAESDRDEAFCRALCERLGVPLIVARRDVNAERERGESVEDAARRIRYAELLAAAKRFGAPLVATAHTANDNAETVLLNLARGAGGAGLAGIPPTRPLGDGVAVVRPLLAATRAEVEQFLAERGQDYVTDSTNLTSDYTRNLIRHEVLPPLLRANARAVEHLCAAAAQAREDEAYLTAEAESLLRLAMSRSAEDTVALTLHHALDCPQPVLSRALRLAYAELSGATLTRAHTEALLAICRSRGMATVDLPGGITARHTYDTLAFERSRDPAPHARPQAARDAAPPPTLIYDPHDAAHSPDIVAPPDPPNVGGDAAELAAERRAAALLPHPQHRLSLRIVDAAPPRRRAGGFDSSRAVYLDPTHAYYVRTRRIGDTFATEKWTKTLKKLMIDLKIPAHLRDSLPVIVADPNGSEIAALPGFTAAKGFAAAIGAPSLEISLK